MLAPGVDSLNDGLSVGAVVGTNDCGHARNRSENGRRECNGVKIGAFSWERTVNHVSKGVSVRVA